MTQFSQLVCSLDSLLVDNQKLYTDLREGLLACLPLLLFLSTSSSTSNRPELVIVSDSEISILELTICNNSPTGFSEAKKRKESKYAALVADLEENGRVFSFSTLEIGTLGHFTKDAAKNICEFLPFISKTHSQSILHALAKTAISCSKVIFQAHTFLSWNSSIGLFSS